jgi:DNA-binding response OmpR family regulator
MLRPALIIENDPDIAESVSYNLKSAGFDPLVAATGEQPPTIEVRLRMFP